MTDTVSETEISFEVWQDGDMVAAADSLADAQHFMAVYGQDGPVEAKTAITTRFPGFNVVTAMLAASPQGEGSSADTPVEAVAWRVRRRKEDAGFGRPQVFTTDDASEADLKQWRVNGYDVQPLFTHPAPIKPSIDTGELRERVAQIIGEAVNRRAPGQIVFSTLEDADAILDLIQSERAGSPIGQNDQPGLAFSGEGEKP